MVARCWLAAANCPFTMLLFAVSLLVPLITLAHRRITNRDYQTLCPEVHPETLRRDLADLVRKDVLLKVGDKRATYYILKDADALE